ncbi:MAG: redox-regulated ATPase YchF [Chloroflexota bacterium]|nr:redox-regulated ATPase YchF [Chloroflexota bacterium]
MSLKIGIVGLPNVGKSTVFNALTGTQNADVANYPFCTIKPNQAIVPLKDARVDKLQELVGVPNAIYATIEFVDIAGLVKGASQGEGLGNQFLGNIRDVDAIVHTVRCFDDHNVVHVSGELDPRADIDTINIELAIADMEQLERKIEKLSSSVKGDKKLRPVLQSAKSLKEHLDSGNPVSSYSDQGNAAFQALIKEMRFLTNKPVIYTANVDETGLAEIDASAYSRTVKDFAAEHNAGFVILCAKLEEEMVDMTPEEQREFLQLAGAEESGLDQIVRKGFETLNLISFFTKNENEVRAWNIPQGTTAPKAAGHIHTDFERGFIRAEVISYERFTQYGSDTALKAAGMMRSEGKDYIVQDGDVILFRFNV